MTAFFELPPEIQIHILEKLAPKELLRMLALGDNKTDPIKNHIRNRAVIIALFMQKTTEAKQYQEKIIQSWLEGRPTYPLVFNENSQVTFF